MGEVTHDLHVVVSEAEGRRIGATTICVFMPKLYRPEGAGRRRSVLPGESQRHTGMLQARALKINKERKRTCLVHWPGRKLSFNSFESSPRKRSLKSCLISRVSSSIAFFIAVFLDAKSCSVTTSFAAISKLMSVEKERSARLRNSHKSGSDISALAPSILFVGA